jgi:thiol-disulfide isomerase/thioredoxin
MGTVLAALLLALLPRAAGGRAGGGGAEVHVYLFWSASCPHCLAARPQIQALAAARPWIVLHDLELGADPAHGERYEAMAAELGEEALAVPALFYCGRMEVGWDAGGDSAARLAGGPADTCRAGAAPPPPTLRCCPAGGGHGRGCGPPVAAGASA